MDTEEIVFGEKTLERQDPAFVDAKIAAYIKIRDAVDVAYNRCMKDMEKRRKDKLPRKLKKELKKRGVYVSAFQYRHRHLTASVIESIMGLKELVQKNMVKVDVGPDSINIDYAITLPIPVKSICVNGKIDLPEGVTFEQFQADVADVMRETLEVQTVIKV